MSCFCNLKGILLSFVLFFSFFITEISAFAHSNVFSLFPSPSLLLQVEEEDIAQDAAQSQLLQVEEEDPSLLLQVEEEDPEQDEAQSQGPMLVMNMKEESSVELFSRILSTFSEGHSRGVVLRGLAVGFRFPITAFPQVITHFEQFRRDFRETISSLGLDFLLGVLEN